MILAILSAINLSRANDRRTRGADTQKCISLCLSISLSSRVSLVATHRLTPSAVNLVNCSKSESHHGKTTPTHFRTRSTGCLSNYRIISVHYKQTLTVDISYISYFSRKCSEYMLFLD